MRRLLLILAAVLGITVPILPVTQAHADFDLRVIWPTDKLINPTRSTYSITVSDTGPGALQARWYGAVVDIPHNGTLDMPFAEDGTGRVEIWRCTPTCAWAGVSSPELKVRRSLRVIADPLKVGATPQVDASVLVPELFGEGPLDLSWRIVAGSDGSGETLASGHPSVAYGQRPAFTITPPPGLVEGGDYSWVVTVTAPFLDGTLTGSSEAQPVVVDTTPPEVAATASLNHIEPVVDGYRDRVVVKVPTSETVRARLDVIDPGGATLIDGVTWTVWAGSTSELIWEGRGANGKPAPPGDYTLKLFVTDSFGNVREVTFPISVGDGKHEERHWQSAALKPAKNIMARLVGECAALSIPSTSQGAGSIGYVADATCYHARTDDGLVWTQYVTAIPASVKDRYQHVELESLASGRSGVNARLMSGAVPSDGRWRSDERGIGAVPQWRGQMTSAVGAVTRSGDSGFLTWRAGVEDRARVDVKRFRINLDYQVLVHPDGTWEVPVG